MINTILLLLMGLGAGAYLTFETLRYNHCLRTKAERDKYLRELDHEKATDQ